MAVERTNNFTRPGAITTRDVHIIALVRYDNGYHMYQAMGVGRPSTGSTGATVSIFLGRDSEARELHAELGGHSFALTGRGHNVLRERPCE